jgi:hypothetical protein
MPRAACGRRDVQPVGALRSAGGGRAGRRARAGHQRHAGFLRGGAERQRRGAAPRPAWRSGRSGQRRNRRDQWEHRAAGPPGPQGTTGPAGQQGPGGPQGPKGNPGAGLKGAAISCKPARLRRGRVRVKCTLKLAVAARVRAARVTVSRRRPAGRPRDGARQARQRSDRAPGGRPRRSHPRGARSTAPAGDEPRAPTSDREPVPAAGSAHQPGSMTWSREGFRSSGAGRCRRTSFPPTGRVPRGFTLGQLDRVPGQHVRGDELGERPKRATHAARPGCPRLCRPAAAWRHR